MQNGSVKVFYLQLSATTSRVGKTGPVSTPVFEIGSAANQVFPRVVAVKNT